MSENEICTDCGKWITWNEEGTPQRGYCECRPIEEPNDAPETLRHFFARGLAAQRAADRVISGIPLSAALRAAQNTLESLDAFRDSLLELEREDGHPMPDVHAALDTLVEAIKQAMERRS